MLLLWLAAVVILASFAGVLLVGAPYVPTLSNQRKAALELLNLKAGQTLYELGCGDGSLLVEAAQQGIKGIGYELNPFLAFIAWLRTRRYKGMVKIHCKSFWSAPIGEADGIYVFLLDRFMPRLDSLVQSKISKPIYLASYTFKVPGKTPTKSKSGIYLYHYRPLANKA